MTPAQALPAGAAPAGGLQWLPGLSDGSLPGQLMLLLHGVGGSARGLDPLAQVLSAAFPQAALVAPEGFEPFDAGPDGRQWFSLQGIADANRAQRVAAVLPRLADWVRQTQRRLKVGPQATALVGFSQGAILGLELAAVHDGLAGRVLAFAGRYASLPPHAPRQTTLHLFHGEADPVIPASHARAAIEHLARHQGDATVDIVSGVGHELAPALVDCALHRLRSHIPHRTWAAALGAAAHLDGR